MENKKLTIKFYSSVVKNVLVPKDFDSLRKKIFSEFCLDELEIKEIEIFYFSPEKKIINNDDDYKIFIENNKNDFILNVIEKSFVVNSKPSKNFTEKITSFISNEMEIAMNNIKNLILNEDNRNDKNNLNLNVHYDFSCNECKKNVICGFVYKCVFEDEICLCEKCCLKHKHPMFKIK